MSSSQLGNPTSAVEVVDISPHGVWILTDDQEHFLPYEHFPWFKQAPVAAVLNVIEDAPGSFRWPDLDVDLCLDSIKAPEKFPLTWRAAQ
jgi:hypothetical protein